MKLPAVLINGAGEGPNGGVQGGGAAMEAALGHDELH